MSGVLSARRHDAELMDTEAVSDADLFACLRDLGTVNTVTLARRPTLLWLDEAVRGRTGPLRILDVASGGGDMLRAIHRWGVRRGITLELTGIDLNPQSATAARAMTPPAMGIRYETGDAFEIDPARRFDVIVSSLFTHHLSDAQVIGFLRWMERTADRGWLVNDLERNAIAASGFALLARAARWHRFVQHDGPLSVRRSFRRREWRALLDAAGVPGRVRMRAPFRLCVDHLT